MSVPTTIDLTAPVIARHAVDIAAPLDIVWALHTDVNAWPTWQTDITAARLEGGFTRGASFTWTSFGLSVTSTIYHLADRAEVLRGGTADGITGIHEWLFTASPTGVQVATNESFAGPPIAADATRMQELLDGSLQSWLAHLKGRGRITIGRALAAPRGRTGLFTSARPMRQRRSSELAPWPERRSPQLHVPYPPTSRVMASGHNLT